MYVWRFRVDLENTVYNFAIDDEDKAKEVTKDLTAVLESRGLSTSVKVGALKVKSVDKKFITFDMNFLVGFTVSKMDEADYKLRYPKQES